MNADFDQEGGWWWPANDRDGRRAILRDAERDIREVLKHVRGRDLIVQAGANVGVYPVNLALHFRSVMTCEPDPLNYRCLVQNVASRDALRRVRAFDAAFGETSGACEPVEVEALNCGAHRVEFGSGSVPVITIDDLYLTACDAIWLDVEGAELPALKGAEKTIDQFGPTIIVEDKGLNSAFGVMDGELQAWLAERNYTEADRFGRDKVYRRV